MEIKFADSFWKSLKVMVRHQTWWYKTYEVFRYKIPMFFENLWYFKKELWNFRSWDYSFNLSLFARSLEKTANTLEFYGHEIDTTRMKKVEKIKRVIQLIENMSESHYLSIAESELGEIRGGNWFFGDDEMNPEDMEHNRKVYNRANELEEQEFEEIWEILKGQDHEEYRKLYNSQSEEEKYKRELWNEWFDGSGMKHWWD